MESAGSRGRTSHAVYMMDISVKTQKSIPAAACCQTPVTLPIFLPANIAKALVTHRDLKQPPGYIVRRLTTRAAIIFDQYHQRRPQAGADFRAMRWFWALLSIMLPPVQQPTKLRTRVRISLRRYFSFPRLQTIDFRSGGFNKRFSMPERQKTENRRKFITRCSLMRNVHYDMGRGQTY